MANLTSSLYNIRLLEDLSKKKTFIHSVHPLIKLLTTIAYLTAVVSFGRYEVTSLLPFVFYPVLVFALAELPLAPIIKRVLMVEPFIIGIGILNPIFDQHVVMLGGLAASRGWITFLSILIKGSLTVTASMLLIATTGIEKLAAALRLLRAPKIFVLQLLLTYRYIAILMEEVLRIVRAYSLRAPGQKGIQWKVWGSLVGQLILRTFDRAQRIYEAMSLRGFSGEYNTGGDIKVSLKDIAYLLGWVLFFVIARLVNIPMTIELLLSGVIK